VNQESKVQHGNILYKNLMIWKLKNCITLISQIQYVCGFGKLNENMNVNEDWESFIEKIEIES
jgi:hypothetical protein